MHRCDAALTPGPADCALRDERACLDGFLDKFKRVQTGPTQPAGPPHRVNVDPKVDQNFDVALVSFLLPLRYMF